MYFVVPFLRMKKLRTRELKETLLDHVGYLSMMITNHIHDLCCPEDGSNLGSKH